MSATLPKGYDETLTVPMNHRVTSVSATSKSSDSQLRGLNGGLLSLATSLGQARTEIGYLNKNQQLQNSKINGVEDAIKCLENKLTDQANLLRQLIFMVSNIDAGKQSKPSVRPKAIQSKAKPDVKQLSHVESQPEQTTSQPIQVESQSEQPSSQPIQVEYQSEQPSAVVEQPLSQVEPVLHINEPFLADVHDQTVKEISNSLRNETKPETTVSNVEVNQAESQSEQQTIAVESQPEQTSSQSIQVESQSEPRQDNLQESNTIVEKAIVEKEAIVEKAVVEKEVKFVVEKDYSSSSDSDTEDEAVKLRESELLKRNEVEFSLDDSDTENSKPVRKPVFKKATKPVIKQPSPKKPVGKQVKKSAKKQ